MTTDTSRLLTVAAAAKLTTLSEPMLRDRLQRGFLKETRIAKMIFIHADYLEAYLQQHTDQRA